jgi:hypothetical protein
VHLARHRIWPSGLVVCVAYILLALHARSPAWHQSKFVRAAARACAETPRGYDLCRPWERLRAAMQSYIYGRMHASGGTKGGWQGPRPPITLKKL